MIEILREEKYKGIRRTIGERMLQSYAQTPHHYQGMSVDVTDLVELRKKLNADHEQQLTLNDFMVRATALALQKAPMMNAHLDLETKMIYVYKSCNIGVIVAIDGGLVCPVIREAQDKSLYEISEESKALFEKARAGKCTSEDFMDGTFTITNVGGMGDEYSTPIMFPGQAGILSVCTTKRMPAVIEKDGEEVIAIRTMMNLFMGGDHRINDGVPMADCLREIKRLLEHPEELLKDPKELQ